MESTGTRNRYDDPGDGRAFEPGCDPDVPVRVLPLSLAEQRLRLVDQLSSAAARHTAIGLRMSGRLDRQALRAALDTIAARHGVLRTAFGRMHGELVQITGATNSGFALIEQDVTGDSEIEQISREACEPFDATNGPLIRGRLLRLSERDHVLLLTQHVAISDAWSMNVLLQETGALYYALSREKADPLPSLALQYVDYATWHGQLMTDELLLSQVEYWKQSLAGAPERMQLPTDGPHHVAQCYSVDRLQLTLSAELAQGLKQRAQQQGATLFATLLSGWAVLLGRWSGQDDVVIGARLANRQYPEFESLIGSFENTAAVRIPLREDATVKELLREVTTTMAKASSHQHVPLERVIDALKTVGSHGAMPQVVMRLNDKPQVVVASVGLQTAGLSVSTVSIASAATQWELSLSLNDTGEGLQGTLEYASNLFKRDTIERLAACWRVLLEGMVADVRQSISRLPMLTAVERDLVVDSFNETAVAYPHTRLIHELVEDQVRRTPAVTAVIYEGQCLTYAELNSRANRLARILRDQGVGPDQLVGICVERSLEMVVGLLGILKAGGAYVPLDPHYPVERLVHMLEDAAPHVVLTQEKLRAKLPATRAEVIALDAGWDETDNDPAENLSTTELGMTARNLVYVIYTSGSTGRPKGTAMAHGSMVNLMEWHRQNLHTRAGERVLQFAALSFDVAFQETFSTLSAGGTLVLLDEWMRRDAGVLAEFLDSRSIQRFFVTPLMLQSLAEHFSATSAAPPRSLQDVITAGEQLRITPEILSFFERLEGCRLHNHYGPTETHVVTALTLTGDPAAWPALPSIGRPIANTSIYVWDRSRQPVPIGVAGEIYIGGAGVARGYRNRPELTAERFTTDPNSDDPNARLYKTGDLGRWRVDGTLEYLGRNDDQVKIRGYRIELGEIEAQLSLHEQVKEAAVIAREDTPGEKRLAAYVTRRDRRDLDINALRAHLEAVLPEYMVPNVFIVLETLPLTPNGKLDRRALQAPESRSHERQGYDAPQGEVEQVLASIWLELLSVRRVGRQDNFFELGGDSLTAMRLVVRVAERFAIRFHALAVFRNPTLLTMAQDVSSRLSERGRGAADGPIRMEVRPDP